MVNQVKYQDLIVESRGVSLKYYLINILSELYQFKKNRPSSLKINNRVISKLDFIYHHLVSNPGSQRDKLLNSKRIYIINFLLSEYQYCFSERIQFKDIKDYLKLTIDNNPKYKKGLSFIHQGVKVISKIYYQTKDKCVYPGFEKVKIPSFSFKPKLEIILSNILCAFQCMPIKPIVLTPDVVKNILMEDINLANNIFDMCIPDDNIIEDKTDIILDEEGVELDSLLLDEEEIVDFNGEYYDNIDGEEEEYKDKITVVLDESDLLEEETIEEEEYDFEEYSDGD